MAGQYDNLIGELQPGDDGWLPLDAAGTPSGPATLQPPPGPNALACAVHASTQEDIDAGMDALMTETGAPITDHMVSNVDRRYPNDPANPVAPPAPVISSISPSTAVCGDVDLEMLVTGTGFTADSIITFNGLDEPTDFHSDTSVGTGVKPSLFLVPATCPVAVRGPGGTSNSVSFEFTAAAGRDSRKR